MKPKIKIKYPQFSMYVEMILRQNPDMDFIIERDENGRVVDIVVSDYDKDKFKKLKDKENGNSKK